MQYLKTPEGHIVKTEAPQHWSDAAKLTRREGEAAYREQAAETLRRYFQPGDTAHTQLLHVSRSGMSRRIAVIATETDARTGQTVPVDVSATVAAALGWKLHNKGGIVAGGCGMDMGFEIVYSMSRAMFPAGFECIGERCPSNDHSNGDRDHTPHHHRDGGYAIRHRWL